mmetsp:Transcript_7244/g.7954  ORF Transcript_7244/g.7954 Transcript_7244/m.7954 type:complete len:210 (-) Transcript_7244:51-680(-)
MGAYKYMCELWRKKQSDSMRYVLRFRAWEYRQRKSMHKCVRPSRTDKAHRLGYKTKPGFLVYRIRIRKGGRRRDGVMLSRGMPRRKPINHSIRHRKHPMSHQVIAETRVGKALNGLRVLNSYWVAADGSHKYFEVILVDPHHPVIRNDPRINWICHAHHKGRERRGLTSAGKKGRGHRGKGIKYKNRPSRRASWRRRNRKSFKLYRSQS